MSPRITFIIPAYNEAGATGQTIADIKRLALPCSIVVCDNNSTDNTVIETERAGATVLHEQVKGRAMRCTDYFTKARQRQLTSTARPLTNTTKGQASSTFGTRRKKGLRSRE